MILGSTNSGKSSLIHAMLGEMVVMGEHEFKLNGNVCLMD
jgi:ribosome biogenesis GTPase A